MEIVTKIAPIALALIMLGLGLGLTTKDFLRVINNPKDFTIGIVCQLILLPIVAYILVLILRLPVEIAVGLMIIAAAPGGVTSNVLTKFANGDVALSISLTAIISLISIISVPFIVLTSANLLDVKDLSSDITMTGIALKMALVVSVPVIIGMIIRKFAECGLQNGTLAVFVATQIFNDIAYMVPTAAYALIMYITGFIFIYILRNTN